METNKKDIINATLLSFKITTYDFEEIKGATVTLYKFRPQLGVRVSKIRGLKDELAAALAVPSVRIIAPLPDGSVGIEVPNKQKPVLPLNSILCSPEYLTSDMELPLAIGRTVTNEIFMADLADMPHLLVAGATGQGKSVGLNVMLMSLLHKKTPDELKLILIDPKKVELSVYSKLADTFLATPVVTEAEEAQYTLQSLCDTMDERYETVSAANCRNIQEYNEKAEEKMPYIVVVIDEYGDLIMQSGKEMERAICRLAQKARAVGIHLIISTQRPSATIVTGNIKANFPTRIAFRTTTGTDSRVILDQVGAEKLVGRGDMLYFSGAEVTRVQCAYVGIDEVDSACRQISETYDAHTYTNGIIASQRKLTQPILPGILIIALEMANISGNVTQDDVSAIAAKKGAFHIGYKRERDLFRQMQELGIIESVEDKWELGGKKYYVKIKDHSKIAKIIKKYEDYEKRHAII
ncbi:MAG: DNA translocase FtsK [Prevotella sp.]|nr:DNA translocase FtsK [Prevotella sp.]